MPSEWEKGFAAGWAACANASTFGEGGGIPLSNNQPMPAKAPAKKRKRGPSAYNKRYAAAYKRLKKKHPRASFASLAKKAHKEARRG